MFFFHEVLERLGIDPTRTRLLRHNAVGADWWARGGEQAFGCFASTQSRDKSPYGGDIATACHFIPAPPLPDGGHAALFVGATSVGERWPWDGARMPRLFDPDVLAATSIGSDDDGYDLEWLDIARPWSRRVLVKWGAGALAWSQWALPNRKPIVELRLQAAEAPFPGFPAFGARVSELAAFPQSWIGALAKAKGVYLLVADDGSQYVGSATGAEGFIGRWRSYAANGHGGNVRLRAQGARDYAVSILEVASPDMGVDDILAREVAWKLKLGARAHGLNAD